MDKALTRSVMYAINALENLPTDVKAEKLFDFCQDCGLPKGVVMALVREPGPTDPGRLHTALVRLENTTARANPKPAAPPKKRVSKRAAVK